MAQEKQPSGDSLDIVGPQFPESVADGVIAVWHKKPGDSVQRNELLAEVETDKVVLEIMAPEAGTLSAILTPEGATIISGQVLAHLTVGTPAAAPSSTTEPPAVPAPPVSTDDTRISPAARRLIAEQGLDATTIASSGQGGRLLKEDVLKHIAATEATEIERTAAEAPASAQSTVGSPVNTSPSTSGGESGRTDKRVPMSRLRARVAERLLQVRQNTAMLTTFNELDMGAAMELRRSHGAAFEEQHGVRLGFMSFFLRAVVSALGRYPEINASIDGDDIVYHSYFDIGVAVSSERGLVVPVMRDADRLDAAGMERWLGDAAKRARAGKLKLEELSGGTFTITNGGVFGSLLSTPILNPPQTAILGMHSIQKRAVVRDGQIVARPMMYVALSYDHCLVDGREAVGFLQAICQHVEQPGLALLNL